MVSEGRSLEELLGKDKTDGFLLAGATWNFNFIMRNSKEPRREILNTYQYAIGPLGVFTKIM